MTKIPAFTVLDADNAVRGLIPIVVYLVYLNYRSVPVLFGKSEMDDHVQRFVSMGDGTLGLTPIEWEGPWGIWKRTARVDRALVDKVAAEMERQLIFSNESDEATICGFVYDGIGKILADLDYRQVEGYRHLLGRRLIAACQVLATRGRCPVASFALTIARCIATSDRQAIEPTQSDILARAWCSSTRNIINEVMREMRVVLRFHADGSYDVEGALDKEGVARFKLSEIEGKLIYHTVTKTDCPALWHPDDSSKEANRRWSAVRRINDCFIKLADDIPGSAAPRFVDRPRGRPAKGCILKLENPQDGMITIEGSPS